jgi:purine-nucleoside phosphorylase
MESFSLFYIAEKYNKKAACLLTVVDSPFIKKKATVEERQNSLNNMIHLALESCIKISTK